MSSGASPFVLALLSTLVACSDARTTRENSASEAADSVSALATSAPDATASSSSVTQSAHGPHVSKRVTLVDGAMGTKIQIQSFTTETIDEDALKAKLSRAFAEIKRLEAMMTTWKDDSEISRINAGAGKTSVTVSPETLAVIDKSLWIAKASEGVFDISFEAMHGIWKFDEDREAKLPNRAALDKARKLVDYRKILLDAGGSAVKLADPGMRISLGGIAKGFAVDAAGRVLEKEGLSRYFVQAGGDLFVRGRKPDETTFKVGVRDPRGKDENDYFAMIEVEDHAFSTAGDYERSFILNGKRYHHIIDPRTGYPATACRSVTIWAEDAFVADAIDDAVFILGPEKGLALVERLEGVGAVIVDKDNRVWISKRLEGKVKIKHPPTDGI